MRICSPQLGLSPNATLGGEVYDREMLIGLANLGTQIEVILPAGLLCDEHPNLRVTRIPLGRGYRWFVSNSVFALYVRQIYRQRPFDLLRVHSPRFTGIAALVARHLFQLPVPVIVHHHHLDRDMWTDHIDRRVIEASDLIITGSEFSKQQLGETFQVSEERIRVVYYGVSPSYVPLPPDEGLMAYWGLQGKRILLYVGSLKERKNLPVLVQAFKMLLQNQDDVCLVLVGRGDQEPKLRNLTQELGLEQAVLFVGTVSEEEKIAWYNLCDVFVHPSRLEGFGLVAAEAMACAKPVVASKASSLPEVVAEGETGLLCDPDDPVAFARAILRLLNDKPLAFRFGQAGRERVRQYFEWDKTVHDTLVIYESMCSGA